MKDKLTLFPPKRFRNFQEVYPDVRHDYLLTALSQKEICEKYELTPPDLNVLIEQIKQELGIPVSTARHTILKKIEKCELIVED